MVKKMNQSAAWERTEKGGQRFMSPKLSFDVTVIGSLGLEKASLTFQEPYHIPIPEHSTRGAADEWDVIFEDKMVAPVVGRFVVGEAGPLSNALALAESIARARQMWELFVAHADIERLPAMHKVDWMVDNVPLQYLPAMTKELLRHAIQSCRVADIHGLVEFLVDWESTVEELIADGEEIEDVLAARQNISEGKGIPWEEAKRSLDR